jgi:polyribonucleotide nucleotidyltransferase
MVRTFRLEELDYEVVIGKYASQADGAVWLKQGGTVVLATVVSAESQEFPGFLPLTIDYREMFAAAGKIPGGYYKREGRSTDKEILTGRLIDRSLRPLFPSSYFNQIQVLATVYSVDKEHMPGTLALIASSLALSISKIPFLGPVGVVEVGRVDGKWVVNPTFSQSQKSDVRVIVTGTEEGIVMVEGSSNEISEAEMVDVFFLAHESIKKQVAWQEQIQKEVGVAKEAVSEGLNWDLWNGKANAFLTKDALARLNIADKVERSKRLKELKETFIAESAAEIAEGVVTQKVLDYAFEQALNRNVTDFVIAQNKRMDNRAFDQIRAISAEVGLLPYNHGSALFTRGSTQALVSVTLGSGQDEQRVESLMEDDTIGRTFMLHYNFPPFSVGEVRPMRGPGRREVGHGYLAASALKYMLPTKEEFSYTIRVVADMLESDGSTSMATTCGTTLSLMQAGVPIKKMVSGIAMGLLRNTQGDFRVLSDISGFEDAFGLMDFKVTGTDDGITAIQMDIKYKGGLPREIFESALAQARQGRLHILGEMRKVMDKPNSKLSDLVPQLETFKISPDKIGAVIGTGGKTIREIIEKTGVASIDIEEDGLVKIFGTPDSKIDMAINWVKTIAGQIESGARYEGVIKRIVDFGIFVELVPGQTGLVHVSNIPKEKQRTFARDYKVNDAAAVEVLDYDSATGRIRLRIIED